MKRVVYPVAAVCLLAAAGFAADSVVEEIIVRINSAIITKSDLQRSKEDIVRECKENKGGSEADCQAELAAREKDALRDLIDQQLLIQKAADDGITGDTELIKRLDEMRKQFNLPTLEDLEKEAAKQGISWEDYKQNIKNQIVTQQVIQREVGPKINITPEDEKKFYDSHQKELDRPEAVRLSEILVSTATKPAKEGDPPGEETAETIAAAQKKADEAAAALKKGDKFEDVAKKYSDGPTSAQGGDLGDFKRGTLAKQLEDRVFMMKKNEVTEPVRTKQGFVILKVTAHQAGGIPPLTDPDVKQDIDNAIYYEKLQPALREFLTKLREQAFIDLKAGYIDTGASPNQTKPVITTAAEDTAAKAKLKKKKKFLVF